MDAHRQAINNSIFLNKQVIGKAAVSDGTKDITKNMHAKQAVLVYRKKASLCLHNC
jgi:hypothetical protein